MTRPTIDEYFLDMAELAATRSTCFRRSVGCVLIDRAHHVLATGFNGVASGCDHCIDKPCPGAHLPSGTGLDKCEAIHAETNALISCRHPEDIWRAYTTVSPCIFCTRQLLNTTCQEIVFLSEYPHAEAALLWRSQGRIWRKYDR